MLPCTLAHRAQLALKEAKTVHETSPPRPVLLQALALRVAKLFERNPDMERFQLTTLLQVQDTMEGIERVVRFDHHIKLLAPGCQEFERETDKLNFFYEWSPYWLMGAGSIILERDDELVQALRDAPANSDERMVHAYALALKIHNAFEQPRHAYHVGSVA